MRTLFAPPAPSEEYNRALQEEADDRVMAEADDLHGKYRKAEANVHGEEDRVVHFARNAQLLGDAAMELVRVDGFKKKALKNANDHYKDHAATYRERALEDASKTGIIINETDDHALNEMFNADLRRNALLASLDRPEPTEAELAMAGKRESLLSAARDYGSFHAGLNTSPTMNGSDWLAPQKEATLMDAAANMHQTAPNPADHNQAA